MKTDSVKRFSMCTAWLAGLLAVAMSGLSAAAQQISVNKDNRTIAVTANADATAMADTAIVHIGYLVYGTDSQVAYANGSKISNAIMQALSEGGVRPEMIQSDEQSVTPVPQYNNQEWTPEEKVERKFQVQQSWSVKTGAKDASKILDLAVRAGANQSGQIEWTVADEDGLQAKAAALALERASRIAEQMAKGLNANLGPLIYASNEAPQRTPEPLARGVGTMAFQAKAEAAPPLAISVRKVTRSAFVYAVFAIQ